MSTVNCKSFCFGIDSLQPNVCSGNGTCVSRDLCLCKSGAAGSNCNLTACYGIAANTSGVCSGHGMCIAPNTCNINILLIINN